MDNINQSVNQSVELSATVQQKVRPEGHTKTRNIVTYTTTPRTKHREILSFLLDVLFKFLVYLFVFFFLFFLLTLTKHKQRERATSETEQKHEESHFRRRLEYYCGRDLLVGEELAAGDRARRLPSLWDFRTDRLGQTRA